MFKNKIATCFINNKAYKIGEYAFLVDKQENKGYKKNTNKRVKILSLYYLNGEEAKDIQFYALVEDDRGICLEVKVNNLDKIQDYNDNSLKYSFATGVFNFKAYETVSGEIKFFISDTFDKSLIY